MAGFLGGALAGGIIVLLFAYVSWRRQLLDLEAAAEERARQLADDMRHQLRVRPHGQLGEPGSSPSSSGRGHALAPARPGQALVGRHSPHARASPQSTAAAASSGSGSHTDASAVTPRRKSELAMIEEFLLTVSCCALHAVLVPCCGALAMGCCCVHLRNWCHTRARACLHAPGLHAPLPS